MVLLIEQNTKRYKIGAFFFSLFFHVFLFVFSLKALISLQGNLSKGREVEVNLVNLAKPKVVVPAPYSPPVVENLIKNVQIDRAVKPFKKAVKIPEIKDTPKMVDIPDIKNIKVKKTLEEKVVDIDENALNKVLVSAHPERYISSVSIKRRVKLGRVVEPIKATPPSLPELNRSRAGSSIPKGLYNSLLARYTALLRSIIEKHKFYPEIAREEGVEGKVLLEFKVREDGRLAFVRVLKSSSYSILDHAAIYSVEKSAPFPPLPKELGKKALTMRLWIKYELGG